MTFPNAANILLCASAGLLLAGLSACRAGFSTSEDTINDPDFWFFTGAGSNWILEMEKNGDEFKLTRSNNPDSSVTITLSGTYEQFTNNGFTLLNITDQDGTSEANDEITLVRASAYAAFLSPIFPEDSSDDDEPHEIMPMVAVANCGSGESRSNWIRFKHPEDSQAEANDPMQFGTLLLDVDEETLTLQTRFDIDTPDQDLGDTELDSGECEDGYIDEPSVNTHYLGADSSALLDLWNNDDEENQRLFAMDISSISAASDFDNDSYGLLYDGGSASGDRNFPILAECTSGTCNISRITDIEDGDTSSQDSYTLLLNQVNTPSNGFITGEINSPQGQAQNAVCMLRLSSTTDEILACVAKSPVDENQMLNLFLVR